MRITTSLLLKRTKQLANETYPIYLRCTLNGQRIELSTGIYVDLENWDEVKEPIKSAVAALLIWLTCSNTMNP